MIESVPGQGAIGGGGVQPSGEAVEAIDLGGLGRRLLGRQIGGLSRAREGDGRRTQKNPTKRFHNLPHNLAPTTTARRLEIYPRRLDFEPTPRIENSGHTDVSPSDAVTKTCPWQLPRNRGSHKPPAPCASQEFVDHLVTVNSSYLDGLSGEKRLFLSIIACEGPVFVKNRL